MATPVNVGDVATRLLADSLGRDADGVWFAPGRVNVIGEHTDYNDGFVLPMALPQGTAAAVARRKDAHVRIVSASAPEPVSIGLAELSPGHPDGWAAYVAGTLWALAQRGVATPGLDIAVAGDVPLGAGLSSSASLECAVASVVNDLTESHLDPTTLAGVARHAENDYVGMPCGVMDQMASMHGARDHVVLIDTRTLTVDPVPFELARAGLTLMVIDTRAPHRLVDGAYAQRRTTCEQAAHTLGVAALRDVDDLPSAMLRLDDEVPRRRVRHVVTENERVHDVAQLLTDGSDPRAIGPLLTASHISLRDDYEVTVPELDIAVDTALATGAHGARMTGGGFGGSIIALVEQSDITPVQHAVAAAFAAHGFAAPVAFTALPSDGAHRLH
jgi:galactokinase